jgi:isopentenyl phosphate kinase
MRKNLLKKIGTSIKTAREKKDFDLIIIHGAGAGGHQLADKYKLKTGTIDDPKKWHGAFMSRIVNQELNLAIADIFVKGGLRTISINSTSAIIQENGQIKNFNLETIKEAISQNCVPILCGDMVFDKKLGMTICSGDAIAVHLGNKLNARKIFFSSDLDGIFDLDPHFSKNAKLFQEINLSNIREKITLSESHNIDVTDGMMGKIRNIENLKNPETESVEIFNGFFEENYKRALLNEKFLHTKVILKNT